MIRRHGIGVGAVVALLAGGCATHPMTTTDAPAPRPAAGPAQPPAAADPPRWEAKGDRPSPAQLAERTATYARTVESPPPDAATARPVAQSSVRFDNPTPATAPPLPTLDHAGDRPVARPVVAVAAPPAAADPRAGVLRSAVANNALSDMPHDVPESADFAQPASAANPSAADPLGVRLAKRAHDHPQDAAAQLDLQLYAMLGGADPAGQPQLAAFAALAGDAREVPAAVVDGVSNYRSAVRANPNLTATEQIRPLEAMLDRLRAQADLTITTVALCRRVDGFGRYDPIAPATFPAGRAAQVIVYCEVDNFLPKQAADGRWETRLAQQVSLYSANGTVVWDDKPRAVNDLCRDRRRDFFAYEKVNLPATLAAGEYKLKVTVTDRNANKVADSDVSLTVGGA